VDDLLTVKEIQDLLKVDRLTVYRMLKDGRLTGFKVGSQWRFPSEEVRKLMSGPRSNSVHSSSPYNGSQATASAAATVLPLHCVQLIKNVFSDIGEIGSVTVAPDGEPLTEMSNSCRFCNLILSSEKGRRGCVASWRALSTQKNPKPGFATCHAGLNYAGAPISLDGELVAMVIAGQCYAEAPDPEDEEARVPRLAEDYGLDPHALAEAAREIRTLDERKRELLGDWLESVAKTFEDVGRERAQLMGRLRTIAAVSALET